MAVKGNIGVTYLIECAERSTSEKHRSAVYQAIAEAGGEAAQDYLVEQHRYEPSDAKKATLIKLIGQASRV
jgi:lipopolysaccharide biosynthesis regulator YciM